MALQLDSFAIQVQQAAVAHLDACDEALEAQNEGIEDHDSPAFAPYCGCNTCIVREVLSVTWELLVEQAQREAPEAE